MHATTPVNVKQLKSELMNHPDKHFVDYLCNGLQYGFDTMVKYDNIKTMECRNNLSARSQKDTVSDLINKELCNGFVYGPFEKLPFDDCRRLILDLSAPHNDTNVSINDLIDKDLCSMTYVKIDDAIRLITKYGKGTKLYGKIPPPRSTCREAATQLPECLRSNVVLNETVKQLWTHAVANTTRSLYNIGFSHFVRFLLLNGITYNSHDLPLVSEDVLIYFIAHCFKVLKLKHTTMKIYLCGIRHAYLKSGYHNPLETPHGEFLPRLTLILKSVKRIQGSQTGTRLPITFQFYRKSAIE
ncbi:unnamed protein product [Mytilus edulis]|uniref:Uncharacterized protein n=1 Tax=Mytilus edulis TaxID=6550 RepID=A0A8S3TLN1_MYTED|nr:unnamed protein product [Mytilus edulis]